MGGFIDVIPWAEESSGRVGAVKVNSELKSLLEANREREICREVRITRVGERVVEGIDSNGGVRGSGKLVEVKGRS